MEKWTMKDGTKIRIREMSDTHLLNTMAMLRRNTKQVYADSLALAYAISSRVSAEMATYFIEQDIDRLESDGPEGMLPDIYFEMEVEASKRGLDNLEPA